VGVNRAEDYGISKCVEVDLTLRMTLASAKMGSSTEGSGVKLVVPSAMVPEACARRMVLWKEKLPE
jgi:hypothetical protein